MQSCAVAQDWLEHKLAGCNPPYQMHEALFSVVKQMEEELLLKMSSTQGRYFQWGRGRFMHFHSSQCKSTIFYMI